jgi:hypothetical protein
MKRYIHLLGIPIRWTILLLGSLILIEELIRVIWRVVSEFGFVRAIVDGVVLYKIGELLIILPLLLIIHLIGQVDKERLLLIIKKWRFLLWIGAGLNLLALFDLLRRADWVWYVVLLAIFGLFLPFTIYRWTAQESKWRARLLGALFAVLFILAYGVSYLLTGYVIAPLASSPPHPAETREARWRQDLGYLASELPRLHKNAFHAISNAAFMEEVLRIDRRIDSLDDDKIRLEFMRLVALIGDAHTSFDSPVISFSPSLPLRLSWFKDDLYVIETTEPYRRALAAKVVKIGDMTTDSVFSLMKLIISHENLSWVRKQSLEFLSNPKILYGLTVISDANKASFTLQDSLGSIFELKPNSCARLDSNALIKATTATLLYRTRAQEKQWYKYLEESKTIYFKYNLCFSLIDFPSFCRDLWRFADSVSAERIIVDLRDNPGGNSAQFSSFLKGIRERSSWREYGRLFIITNCGTFSSAILNAADLRQESEAIVVGEEPGGLLNAYGDVRRFHLPNSDGIVTYSTQYFDLMPEDQKRLIPDIIIGPTIEDYLYGRDPILDTILAFQVKEKN